MKSYEASHCEQKLQAQSLVAECVETTPDSDEHDELQRKLDEAMDSLNMLDAQGKTFTTLHQLGLLPEQVPADGDCGIWSVLKLKDFGPSFSNLDSEAHKHNSVSGKYPPCEEKKMMRNMRADACKRCWHSHWSLWVLQRPSYNIVILGTGTIRFQICQQKSTITYYCIQLNTTIYSA